MRTFIHFCSWCAILIICLYTPSAVAQVMPPPLQQQYYLQHTDTTQALRQMNDCPDFLFTFKKRLKSENFDVLTYEQYYKGKKILNTHASLLYQKGVLYKNVGHFISDCITALQPTLQIEDLEHFLKTIYPQANFFTAYQKNLAAAEMVYYTQNQQLLPVYVVYADVLPLHEKRMIWIDAHHACILYDEAAVSGCNSPANGIGYCSGALTFSTDFNTNNNNYVLRSCLAEDNTQIVHTTDGMTLQEYSDSDNIWDTDNADIKRATEAQVAISAANRYFYLKGIPFEYLPNQQEIRVEVNYPAQFAAYSNYENIFSFGKGAYSELALTAFEVAAHEYTHSVTYQNNGLQANGETGIINEAISDIYAVLIQRQYFGGEPNWHLGACIGGFNNERHLQTPNLFACADTYEGIHWTDAASKHQKSTVFSHWFYVLAEGESGINDQGRSYQVQGIGLEQAEAILFHTIAAYLGSSTTFEDFRANTLAACADLYGICSEAYAACNNAWQAVGLGQSLQLSPPEGLSQYSKGCRALLKFKNNGLPIYYIMLKVETDTEFAIIDTISYAVEDTLSILVENLEIGKSYVWQVRGACAADNIYTSEPAVFNISAPLEGAKIKAALLDFCSIRYIWEKDPLATEYSLETLEDVVLNPYYTTDTTLAIADYVFPNENYTVRFTTFYGEDCMVQSDSVFTLPPDTITCEISESFSYKFVTDCEGNTFISPFVINPLENRKYDFFIQYSGGEVELGADFYPLDGILWADIEQNTAILSLDIICYNEGSQCGSRRDAGETLIVYSEPSPVCTPPQGFQVSYKELDGFMCIGT